MIYRMKQSGEVTQHSAAEKLLLFGLRAEYGMEALPEIRRSEYGKPYFPDHPEIWFNYSHSRCGILCGISNRQIGVDIERTLPLRESLARYICHEREWKLFEAEDGQERRRLILTHIWTAKESYLKCTGVGLRVKLKELDFSEILEGGVFLEEYALWFEDGDGYTSAVCEKTRGIFPPHCDRKMMVCEQVQIF